MRFVLSLAIAAAFLFAPLQARAVPVGRTIEYYTTYYLVYPVTSPGEYPGRMTLRFSATGEVSGLYRDEYVGGYVHVAGGYKGKNVWLSFGGAGASRRFEGTLHEDDTMTGSLMHWYDRRTYKFSAVPITTSKR